MPSSDLDEVLPRVRPIDLSSVAHVHVVGIGGAGMRAIARVLLGMGLHVSGSDRADTPHVAALRALGAEVFVGHATGQIGEADLVTRSTAVPDDNPEIVEALQRGVPVSSRAETLTAISKVQPSLLVAGTHGKTTTSSMLASILEEAGRHPSFIIGSDVARFGTGARWNADSPMVIEADESDGTFLVLAGSHAIVTSLDPDHLEYYGSRERLTAAFEHFVDGIAGSTVVCLDDGDMAPLLSAAGVITYGTDPAADLHIADLEVGRFRSTCRMIHFGTDLGPVEIGLPGRHNARNAAGAAALALQLGATADDVRAGLAGFGGVARRFEARGSAVGVDFVDDYAHLPAEVEATVSTARRGWRRVVGVYQPHRYSRTEALGHTFAECFAELDHLVLTGIYPSGEAPRPGVSGRIVFDAVRSACPDLRVDYCETLDEVVELLDDKLEPGDLCLTLGAGDLTHVPDRLIEGRWHRWATNLGELLASSVVHRNESVGARTTYRVGGEARVLIEISELDDLFRVIDAAHAAAVPVLMVGRGSNLLVADAGFDGLVLVLDGDFARVDIDEGDGRSIVTAGAAVALPTLARQTVTAGLTGFEWAVGVPGTIGGAIVMNAGGHGSDMAASVIDADLLDPATGRVERVANADLGFGYRTSAVGSDRVVVAARLELHHGDASRGRSELSEIVRWRREHQPGGQNAGSVFTNPEGDSAGRLIDVSGCKGLRVGSAEVSSKHANFIQVDPDGSADDVVALMQTVAATVAAATGVALEPETRLVGFPPFHPSTAAVDPATRGDS